jgi:phage N-6-adenine-methyltransferase
MITTGMMTSLTDDWGTPIDFFETLNKEFSFELDVCASEHNHKCDRYYTIKENGLEQEWENVNWCNPPYGRNIGNWIKKAYEENKKGKTVVLLIPSRTDTKWFHDYIYNQHEIRFIKGRLKFNDGKNPAPFPSMIVVMKGE